MMKNIIIKGVYVDGMQHWSRRDLDVDVVHYCKPELTNPYDRNDVAVFSDAVLQKTAGYLRREDASSLQNMFTFAEGKVFFLKAKMSAAKFNRQKGPMQLCNVGFNCQDRDVDSVCQLLSGYDVKLF